MASQTIAVDQDAYELLDRLRRADESFSDAIKRIAGREPPGPSPSLRTPEELEALRRRLAADPLSDEAIEAVEQVIAQRNLPINHRDPWAEDAGGSGERKDD